MRFNQFSFIKNDVTGSLEELNKLGFALQSDHSQKKSGNLCQKVPFPDSQYRLCPV